jgi:hypothetical protein
MSSSTYVHTQRAPLWLILEATALYFVFAAWLVRTIPGLVLIMIVVGILMMGLGFAVRHLTVEDEGDHLAIRFGPLRLFRTRLAYEDIRGVEVGRTLILDGWGIHWSLRGGWVWNLWGRDCVIVHLPRGVFVLGTDDPINLERFLEDKITP